MLDIGFSELLLIAMVALVVVGPKDLPMVIRHCAKFLREMRDVYAGLKRQVTYVMDEVGVNDITREMTTIIDLEGKPQQAFDVGELEALKQSPVASRQSPVASRQSPVASESAASSVVPPPVGGRLGGGHSMAPSEHTTPPPQPSFYEGVGDSASRGQIHKP